MRASSHRLHRPDEVGIVRAKQDQRLSTPESLKRDVSQMWIVLLQRLDSIGLIREIDFFSSESTVDWISDCGF